MKHNSTYDVFISYRRQGGAVKAELTKNELEKRGFKSSRIFLDTRSISSGNYLDAIRNAISNTENIVVIITKDCFMDLPANSIWINEIEYAIKLKKNIVPIYFDNITEIKADEIPFRIRHIVFENAVQYVHQYTDASFNRLASRLPKHLHSHSTWNKWLIGGIMAVSIATGSYIAINNNNNYSKHTKVYVVSSPNSKSYHSTRN